MHSALDEYREVSPKGTVDFLYRLSDLVQGKSFLHLNAVRYGGGMSEVLRRLVPMMLSLGVEARWEVLAGSQEYFVVITRMLNALQGRDDKLTDDMYQTYAHVIERNAKALKLEADMVMVHDHQPAGLVDYRTHGCWLWRCHLDLAQPQRPAWAFLRRYVLKYDAAIFSLSGFAQRLPIPKFLMYPSIDPLSPKNRDMSRSEIAHVLDQLGIPRVKPIILQVARFDRFKDPLGAIHTYRLVKRHQDCQLVLAGSGVMHDPEGEAVLMELREAAAHDPDIHVIQLPPEADLEINALQRSATVVLQKSVKEGFALTVSEAMWKGKPVVGSTAGGIAAQIVDGVTGYVVHSVEGAAFRIRHLLNNPGLMNRMGAMAREHVRRNFLITRQLGDYLTLLKLLPVP
ncbi:MAG: glycosyltransferase [Nitrospira sp. NTP1]|nr:glycosyltransferase [Nitrospira sp. NTP1]